MGYASAYASFVGATGSWGVMLGVATTVTSRIIYGLHRDIYGLGGVGYFLLTGKPMFNGSTLLEIACHGQSSQGARYQTGDCDRSRAGKVGVIVAKKSPTGPLVSALTSPPGTGQKPSSS